MKMGGMTDPAAEIASLLAWWQEAGVDVLVDDATRDWLAPVMRLPMSVAKPVPAVALPAAPPPLPDTLAGFQQWLATSADILLPPSARIAPAGDSATGRMLLIDLPEAGDLEDGQLMTGETGRLFDRMIAAIGRDRASVYLAAMAPGRPAGGYVDPASADLFARLARHHVAVARPRALLLMGDAPSRALLGTGFIEARGRIHEVDLPGGPVRAVATFHPRTLLQHPAQKARAWADLQLYMTIET